MNNQMSQGGFGMNNNSGFGSNSTGFGSGSNGGGFGGFGNKSSGFGGNSNSGFGNNSNSGFGSSSTGGFGSSGFGSNTGGFGSNNGGFGSSSTGGFGSNSGSGFGSSSGAFGGNKSAFGTNSSGAFGTSSTTGGFGSSNTSGFGSTSGGFGSTNSGFGSNNSGGFGGNKSGFGSSGFGANNSSGFGNKGGFGTAGNTSGFGSSSGGFGSNTSGFGSGNTSGFGSSSSGFGSSNTGGFGSSTGGFGSNKSGFGSSGFGTNNTTGGFGTNNTTGGFGSSGFGSNNSTTGGFGANNNTGGFGSSSGFGTNNTTGGFGSSGFGTNKTGFGTSNGFGSNNTGFGTTTNSFGSNNNSFGTTTNTSFGFNNSNPNGNSLLAGGFNQITNLVTADPYAHIQQLGTSFSELEGKIELATGLPRGIYTASPSPSHPITPNFIKTFSKHAEPAVKEATGEAEAWRSVESDDSSITLQVEYEDALYPVKCHKNDSIAAVKKAIRSVTPITTAFYLVFNHAVLSDVELVRFQLKDGSRVSVCVDPSQPSSHALSSSSYHSRAPTLHNPEYTISPSIEELKSLMNCELACVKNVSIERKGVGRIEWLEGVDLRDVAIDEVVEIERDEGGAPSIAVYYNDDEHSASYPRPGTGLNHPAILTFFGIKAKHLRDKDAFVSFLKLESEKLGAEFVAYDADKESWQIKVNHFSRYGLGVEEKREREGEEPEEPKRVKGERCLWNQSATCRRDTEVLKSVAEAKPAPASLLELLSPFPPQAREEFQRKEVMEMSSSFSCIPAPTRLVTSSPCVTIITSSASSSLHSLPTLRSAVVYTEDAPSATVPQIRMPQGSELLALVSALAQEGVHAASEKEKKNGLLWELVRVLFVSDECVSGTSVTCRSNDLFGQYPWEKEVPFSVTSLSPSQKERVEKKRTEFGRWLDLCAQSGLWSVCVETDDSVFASAVNHLLHHEVLEACTTLRQGGYERLAVLVAQISRACVKCVT